MPRLENLDGMLSRTRTKRCSRCCRRKISDKFSDTPESSHHKKSNVCIECEESVTTFSDRERVLRGKHLQKYDVPIADFVGITKTVPTIEIGYIGADGELYDTPEWEPPADPTQHAFRKCRPDCHHLRFRTSCPYQSGVIKDCVKCGLMDGELTTECPNNPTHELMAYFAFEGSMDFINGSWTMGDVGRKKVSV